MKQGSNSRRPRGRRNSDKRSPNRNNNHDHGGSDLRLRGNASQVYEKYLALARDALSVDDSISSENYSQHAEHFYRIMTSNAENQKNSNNSGQGQNHNNDKNKEQTSNQKERSKNRRNHSSNPANNHKIDPTVENKDEKDQLLEEQNPDQNKTIKKVEIKVPEEDLQQDVNNKEGTSQESGSA